MYFTRPQSQVASRATFSPGNFSRDKTFRNIPCFQIGMSVDRADFAGDIKPRDRFLHRIEDALVDVVFGAALSVIQDCSGFYDIKWPLLNRHHAFRRCLWFYPRFSAAVSVRGIFRRHNSNFC